jgi:hypothetical protein
MVRALEERGHECTLLLYDVHSDDVSHHEATIRASWPNLKARISSATRPLPHLDAIVASSWATAHVVASVSTGAAQRFYFIQDYEPYFYPHGYLYELAERTYHFGFHNLALGGMVAQELRTRAGVEPAAVVPFGCDVATYGLLQPSPGKGRRTGIVYYAKQNVDRRGYELARATLACFHKLRPDQKIHVYGDVVRGWPVPVTNHGSMAPAELNRLYNATLASLAMSFTNVSLVPGELLATGNIPVLNASPDALLDLDSPFAVWAEPTPEALARALVEVVDFPAPEERAVRAAATAPSGWESAQSNVVQAIERSLQDATPTAGGEVGGHGCA